MAAPKIIEIRPLPPASAPWIKPGGSPEEAFSSFMLAAAKLLAMINGVGGVTLVNAANDAAAAALSVPVGALYRNGSIVMIRVV